jgi:hypothetical protein
LEAVEQGSEVLLEPGESLEILIVILLAIEPSINAPPDTRRKVNHAEITPADKLVEQAVGLGKKIAQFDLGLRGDLSQPITNSSRGAIVTLSKTGGEEQYSLHDSLGDSIKTDLNTAEGSLLAKAFGV